MTDGESVSPETGTEKETPVEQQLLHAPTTEEEQTPPAPPSKEAETPVDQELVHTPITDEEQQPASSPSEEDETPVEQPSVHAPTTKEGQTPAVPPSNEDETPVDQELVHTSTTEEEQQLASPPSEEDETPVKQSSVHASITEEEQTLPVPPIKADETPVEQSSVHAPNTEEEQTLAAPPSEEDEHLSARVRPSSQEPVEEEALEEEEREEERLPPASGDGGASSSSSGGEAAGDTAESESSGGDGVDSVDGEDDSPPPAAADDDLSEAGPAVLELAEDRPDAGRVEEPSPLPVLGGGGSILQEYQEEHQEEYQEEEYQEEEGRARSAEPGAGPPSSPPSSTEPLSPALPPTTPPTPLPTDPAKDRREPTSLREALGHIKEGIKSAAKDTSPIREALGHLQQGLRTAISETTTTTTSSDDLRVSNPPPLSNSAGPASPVRAVTSDPGMHAMAAAATNGSDVINSPKEAGSGERATSLPMESNSLQERSDGGSGDAAVVQTDVSISDGGSDAVSDISDVSGDVVEVVAAVPPPPPPPSSSSRSGPPPPRPPLPNGVRQLSLDEFPEHKELKARIEQLSGELRQQKEQNLRLKSVSEAQDAAILKAHEEADRYRQLKEVNAKSSEEIFLAQIKALEVTIADLQKQVATAKDKLMWQDRSAKEAISKLQHELKTRVEQVTSMYEATRKEKEDMVLKYARAESKNIEMETRMSKNDARMKEMAKERENVLGKFKSLKTDQMRCRELFETRSTEVLQLRRELERQKELFVSQEGKTKWAHNKLRQEIEQHKDTRAKLDEAIRKNKASRDEAEQIRRDCQSMIKVYQESEEIKSNNLDQELKQKETELMQHRQEKLDQQEVHSLVRRELETLKMKHKEIIEELKTWRDKVTCLDAERIIQEQNLDKYRETLQKQKETNATLEKRFADLEDVEKELNEVKEENTLLSLRNEELETEAVELRSDMERCSAREQEHLTFTQKISDKNAHLQSENSALSNKACGLEAERERLAALCEQLTRRCETLDKELAMERHKRKEEVTSLTSKVTELTKQVETLTVEVADERSQIKTLKRKHAANTKDLTRQLQAAKRRLETLEPKDGTSSMGSRTSSNGSLDTVSGSQVQVSRSASTTSQPQVEPEPFVEIVEVDKQMLIEKIVRLQKAHARKNEKLEFMEDHIQQLFTEVQKKNRIIQNYALREEAGTITSESADTNKMITKNKALLAKKGGIMASLYTSHQQDGSMTLDLSLDINRKLQAVLEDTLLKNITLKENLDTLGEEIARLSQENRSLQLNGQPQQQQQEERLQQP